MGRCNNRRTQQAAQALQNTPSRARFSSGGRATKGRGRKGGRGGRHRTAAEDRVVNKISQRVAGVHGVALPTEPAQTHVKKAAVSSRKHPVGLAPIEQLDSLEPSPAALELAWELLRQAGIVQSMDVEADESSSDDAELDHMEEEAADDDFEGEEDNDVGELQFSEYDDEPDYEGYEFDTATASSAWEGDARENQRRTVELGSVAEEEPVDPCDAYRQDPIFVRLTQALSFTEADAVQACKVADGKLVNALDWLCLHLTPAKIEEGFVKKNQIATVQYRVMDHPSISLARSLTEDREWQRRTQLEERASAFVRLGFPFEAAQRHCEGHTNSENGDALGDTRVLVALLEQWQYCDQSESHIEDVELEREQEREALEAIYGDDFVVSNEGDITRYRILLPIDELDEPCELHVFLRSGYLLSQTPLFLVYHASLAPSLMAQINQGIVQELRIGEPITFEIVNYLINQIPTLRDEFSREQRTREFEAEQRRLRLEAGHVLEEFGDDPESLSRRQKARMRAEIKRFGREDERHQKEVERRQRQAERIEQIKVDEQNIRQTMAARAIEERDLSYHGDEIRRLGRAAMNAAFNRGANTEEARAAAREAENQYRSENGLAVTPEESELKTLSEPKSESIAGESTRDNRDSEVAPAKTVTPTTLAFMSRLREMYAAAKEAGTGTYKLGRARKQIEEEQHLDEVAESPTVESRRVPEPVAVPVGDLVRTLEGIRLQQDQPWLVAEEARYPMSSDERIALSDADISKRDDLSAKLRVALEQNKRSNAYRAILAKREQLPAFQARRHLVDVISSNQVTVVAGDTGCGKTTQVPQLVLDAMIEAGHGAEANVIVTQPRRISAIGVSERIAVERCEKVGDTCGYSIKLEKKFSGRTRLLLCTTGILLRRLQCDPDLANVSHVFVDEVHERDLNTDFLLIILKELLARRPSLKLVLMSATLNATAFSDFFDGCTVVSIPGRAFPVREFRLEDVLKVTGYEVAEGSDYARKSRHTAISKSALRKMYYPRYDSSVIQSLSIVDERIINYELLAELLEFICVNQEEGAILVFLPGMLEISKAIDEMRRKEMFQSSSVVIYPLHSSLSTAEQTAVFDKPPNGVRKIVVSTNIAETSITIEDVVYVVDSGRVKENRRDEAKEAPALVECWVSRASAKQRRGRAGRVRPGIAYHMYSSHTHDNELQDYQLPEMLRVGLEDLALQILILDLGEPSQFLAKALDPPTAMTMKNSLKLLESLGAVECSWKDPENGALSLTATAEAPRPCSELNVATELTALGFHLASLPVEPRIGKMMIYGALFGCVDPALTIAATMSSKNPFASSFELRQAVNEARGHLSLHNSDHLTSLNAFNQWKQLRQTRGEKEAQMYLRENYLSRATLFQMEDLRRQYASLLSEIGFLPDGFRLNSRQESFANSNSSKDTIVRAVLCAGLYPNVVVAPRTLMETSNARQTAGEVPWRSRQGDAYLHPSALAFSACHIPSRYAVYYEMVKTSKLYVRDSTPVNPLALLLFGGTLNLHRVQGALTVDQWLQFRVTPQTATLLKHLRAQMEAMLLKKILSPSEEVDNKLVLKAVEALLEERSDGAEIVRPYQFDDRQRGRGGRGRGRGGRGGRGRRSAQSD